MAKEASDRTAGGRAIPREGGQSNESNQSNPVGNWVVVVLDVAKKEGRKILSDPQYDHVVEIIKRLVNFGDKIELNDLSIEPIGSFWELREKGGVLGRINLRIYFGTWPEAGELIVAKSYKKEQEGKTPRHIIIAVEDRLEAYKEGKLREHVTVHWSSGVPPRGDA